MTSKYIKMFDTINHQGHLNVKFKMLCRVISVIMAMVIMTNSGEIRWELLHGIGGMQIPVIVMQDNKNGPQIMANRTNYHKILPTYNWIDIQGSEVSI